MISYDCYIWDDEAGEGVYCGSVEIDEIPETGDLVETDEGIYSVVEVNEEQYTIDVEEA